MPHPSQPTSLQQVLGNARPHHTHGELVRAWEFYSTNRGKLVLYYTPLYPGDVPLSTPVMGSGTGCGSWGILESLTVHRSDWPHPVFTLRRADGDTTNLYYPPHPDRVVIIHEPGGSA